MEAGRKNYHNFARSGIKTAFIRIGDNPKNVSTTDVWIGSGTGAPSGAYNLPGSSDTALYIREDASTVATGLYITVNSGTAWTAMDPTALSGLDLNGTELILDADGDTTLTADTDDQIDIKISGADDFQFTANTFTALSGSTIKADTIAETTGGSGVTIDGLLVKDYGISRAATGGGEDLTIALTGAQDASVHINSAGTGTDAIGIAASAGGITMSSTAVASAWTHTATGAADDLTIEVAGAVDASLHLLSAGTGADSISVVASAGGIDLTAAGDLDIVGTTTADFGDGTGVIHFDGSGAVGVTGVTTWSYGADGTGVDVKFFGDTASEYLLWDQSADAIVMTAAVSITGQGSTVVPLIPIAAQQDLTGAGAVTITEYYTAVTNTGADALTLVDGAQVGQLKKIQMIADPGTDSTLTPTNLNGGTTITFADVGDYVVLCWSGSDWVAIELGNDADGATAPVLA